MAHPMAGQAQASQKARLRRLGATAGKPWGSSSMYKKKTLPKKNAGTEREFTIPGGKGRKRADRMAAGGNVKSRHKPHHTTNIVIAAPGGAGGRGFGGGGGSGRGHPVPLPVPVRPPMPGGLPVGGAPPVGAAPPIGGGLPPAGLAGAPIARPPIAAGAGAPMPVRPPMPGGMKRGGHVKKRKIGGDDGGGKGYPGFPHSPTADTDAVSAHKTGGAVHKRQAGGTLKKKNGGDSDSDDNPGASSEIEAAPSSAAPAQASSPSTQKRGGKVKKRQVGGGSGGGLPYGGLIGPRPGIQTAMPEQQGAPTVSGRPALPSQRQMIPAPNTLASQRLRPAPGTQVGFKKGGKAEHGDEAEDKKLFKKMYKEEEAKEKEPKKRKRGGSAGDSVQSAAPMRGLNESKYHDWGEGHRKRGGSVGDSVTMAAPTTLAGPKYRNQGVGKRQMGGSVKPRPGAGSGLGRLRANRIAAKVPAKTEL
jgi:hypothetical protein